LAIIPTNPAERPSKEAGFTLVEILCVLALLGLTAGLVVLNLPKPAPPLESEAQRVTTLLNLAVRQSLIDGKSRGFDITPQQLEIYEYDGEWTLEHQQAFTDDVRGVELMVEGQEIDLRDRQRKKQKFDLPPLIYFDAVGNVTPFDLSLEGREQSFRLASDDRGRVAMEASP